MFVTLTDIHVEPDERMGVTRIFEFEAEAARLVAEGQTAADSGYVFRRWRFSPR